MKNLKSQFGNPHGMLGWLAGSIMSYRNHERNLWAVTQLRLQPRDQVLEIGFGPGIAIREAAALAVEGQVYGVDRSNVMVQQARRRNRRTYAQGRVRLRQGSVEALPYEDDLFDVVYAINSFHHWSDPAAGLREVLRVLKPGGLVALIEHPRGEASREDVTQLAQHLQDMLTQAGFKHCNESRSSQEPPTVCVLGYTC